MFVNERGQLHLVVIQKASVVARGGESIKKKQRVR
jgi:hypothetical protein